MSPETQAALKEINETLDKQNEAIRILNELVRGLQRQLTGQNGK